MCPVDNSQQISVLFNRVQQELKLSVRPIYKQKFSNAILSCLSTFLTVYCTVLLLFISPTQTTQPHSESEDCLLFITPTPRLTTTPIRCGQCANMILFPYTALLGSVFIIQARTIPSAKCINTLYTVMIKTFNLLKPSGFFTFHKV